MASTKTPKLKAKLPYQVILTPAIDNKVEEAIKATGLKKPDVVRMALDRGVDILLNQLTAGNAA